MGVEVLGFGLTPVCGSKVAGLAAGFGGCGASDERWQVWLVGIMNPWYERHGFRLSQRSPLSLQPDLQTIEAVVSTELHKVLQIPRALEYKPQLTRLFTSRLLHL